MRFSSAKSVVLEVCWLLEYSLISRDWIVMWITVHVIAPLSKKCIYVTCPLANHLCHLSTLFCYSQYRQTWSRAKTNKCTCSEGPSPVRVQINPPRTMPKAPVTLLYWDSDKREPLQMVAIFLDIVCCEMQNIRKIRPCWPTVLNLFFEPTLAIKTWKMATNALRIVSLYGHDSRM
jgi:hypothetical protein